jgi:hypothetical protein
VASIWRQRRCCCWRCAVKASLGENPQQPPQTG